MRFRTNKIFEKNKQGKQSIGLGLDYPSAEAIEIKKTINSVETAISMPGTLYYLFNNGGTS